MPEHRAATPREFAVLESFLWNDFGAGPEDWRAWVRRNLPEAPERASEAAFGNAMRLHAALGSLQAANAGLATGDEAGGRKAFNRLVAHYAIQPRLGEDGLLGLASDRLEDPCLVLILMALQALRSGLWRRFKRCREPTCRASYYDASKAASKTWCSMQTCGSRDKMRRYRARACAQADP